MAFRQTIDLWELIPVPGISRNEFAELGKALPSELEAHSVAQYLVGNLLWRSLNAVDAMSRGNTNVPKSIFISYSRKNSDWVARIRTLMRPAERRGLLSTWVDADIEAGKPWESQILGRVNKTDFALLLISKSLSESTYVRNIEIPAFTTRMKEKDSKFRLFWVLLEPCDWQSITEIKAIQAIGSVKTAINQSPTNVDEQCRLIEIVETITNIVNQ